MRVDNETAFDLTQETFARAFKSLSSFASDRPFKPWLMKICRNLAIDNLKTRSRLCLNLFETTAQTEDRIQATNANLDLQQAIAQLPPRQQEIVEMHYFWELTCREIGEQMAIPSGTVKSELFQARKCLLKILEKDI